MDYIEFSSKIKDKYPQYSDMDDLDLAKKMVDKYPSEYGDVKFPSITGSIRNTISETPELQPYGEPALPTSSTSPVKAGFEAARQTLAFPSRVGRTLVTGPNVVGDATAEILGEVGYPKTGAALGTVISVAPEILGAYGALRGLATSEIPFLKALRSTPRQLGPEFKAGEKAAGITERLPELRGSQAQFPKPEIFSKQPRPIQEAETLPSIPPKSYPRDTSTFVNFARDRISKFGDKLSPQELGDYKSVLAEKFTKGDIVPNTPQGATASQLLKDVTKLHNEVIPGREQLNLVYSISKKIHPDIGNWLVEGVKKYGKSAVSALLVGAGAGLGLGAATKYYGSNQRR